MRDLTLVVAIYTGWCYLRWRQPPTTRAAVYYQTLLDLLALAATAYVVIGWAG